MVVGFRYLWSWESVQGHDSAAKLRPCLIVGIKQVGKEYTLSLMPITHRPQYDSAYLEIPKGYLKEAGLDGHSCFVIPTEVNIVKWPPASSDHAVHPRGKVPDGWFVAVRAEVHKAHSAGKLQRLDRDEFARDIIEAYRDRQN